MVFEPVRPLLVSALPWAGMFVLVILTIGILYRYGPNVKTPRTPILTVGALFAAVLWSAGSIAFSAYLSSFNSYNRIYGSIGTVVALLMWFYLAGFSVLLGRAHQRRDGAAAAHEGRTRAAGRGRGHTSVPRARRDAPPALGQASRPSVEAKNIAWLTAERTCSSL